MSATVSYVSSPIVYCARCNEPFSQHEEMACTGSDEFWHLRCFVCARCFKPFNDKHEYYEYGGRKYCEQDFLTLFAPCCSRCNQYIIGRFIRALNKSWHPNCFLCDRCRIPLADHGFIKSNQRALCHDCNAIEKVSTIDKYICEKCKQFIDGQPLKIKDEPYHAYHFNCCKCGVELRPDARQINQELYCLKCHDKMGIPICGACRRPIEERIVTALGKQFHVDHFVCAHCEKPFLGKRHYEWKGSAYCERDFLQLFGHQCFSCNQIIKGDVVSALDRYWCVEHFACAYCELRLLVNKSKFYNVQSKPCCKKCYEKFPRALRKRLAEEHRREKSSKKQQQTPD